VLRDGNGRVISEVRGSLKGDQPFTLGRQPDPAFELITVGDISEVIEHRRPEPIFYVSDDEEVNRLIRVSDVNRPTPP
jgi:hypothetical protein